jgi:hypothetical protein
MGGRMRDKRRPPSPNVIRRAAPLTNLHHVLPPTSELPQFAAATTSEIERLQTYVKQAQRTIADLRQMQSLIDRLDVQGTPVRGRLPHATVAVAVLRAVGHPMQLSDLLAAMAARGAKVAGKTERQRRSNLIITLSRSPLVRRVGHGVYALTESRASA